MSFLLCLTFSIAAGETYSEFVSINGVGRISLPLGKWTVEHSVVPRLAENSPEVYVFRKEGTRLERLTIQKFRRGIAHGVFNYFDSIGDSTSQGIPIHLVNNKSEHDTISILRAPQAFVFDNGKPVGARASYIYASEDEAKDPWISHAVVFTHNGDVFICVHASPHVIAPSTIDAVYSESIFSRDN